MLCPDAGMIDILNTNNEFEEDITLYCNDDLDSYYHNKDKWLLGRNIAATDILILYSDNIP